MTPSSSLKLASLAEATTLAALVLIAVPMKHLAGADGLVRLMGPVHGATFLLYVWVLVWAASAGGWRASEVVRMVVVACIPLAGFINQPWLTRKLHAVR